MKGGACTGHLHIIEQSNFRAFFARQAVCAVAQDFGGDVHALAFRFGALMALCCTGAAAGVVKYVVV